MSNPVTWRLKNCILKTIISRRTSPRDGFEIKCRSHKILTCRYFLLSSSISNSIFLCYPNYQWEFTVNIQTDAQFIISYFMWTLLEVTSDEFGLFLFFISFLFLQNAVTQQRCVPVFPRACGLIHSATIIHHRSLLAVKLQFLKKKRLSRDFHPVPTSTHIDCAHLCRPCTQPKGPYRAIAQPSFLPPPQNSHRLHHKVVRSAVGGICGDTRNCPESSRSPGFEWHEKRDANQLGEGEEGGPSPRQPPVTKKDLEQLL